MEAVSVTALLSPPSLFHPDVPSQKVDAHTHASTHTHACVSTGDTLLHPLVFIFASWFQMRALWAPSAVPASSVIPTPFPHSAYWLALCRRLTIEYVSGLTSVNHWCISVWAQYSPSGRRGLCSWSPACFRAQVGVLGEHEWQGDAHWELPLCAGKWEAGWKWRFSVWVFKQVTDAICSRSLLVTLPPLHLLLFPTTLFKSATPSPLLPSLACCIFSHRNYHCVVEFFVYCPSSLLPHQKLNSVLLQSVFSLLCIQC